MNKTSSVGIMGSLYFMSAPTVIVETVDLCVRSANITILNISTIMRNTS